ncbi:head GIN domain-containing protein [uncultured Aquimarina sp.]|uniref:head GIN domain-containing protein n=1 Tax=uncultured Aquimarina sp. TaxID=575652 RepID=UPI0026085849|nr:head GIN domain-containing protein [uncultured Aquimarina sp.]
MIKKIIYMFLLSPMMMFAQKTTVELAAFDELKVYDAINVTLIKAAENKAVITGDDVDQVAIVSKNGRVKVKMEIDNILDGKDTNVTIYHTEDLALIDANENSVITSNSTIESKYITIRAQEGAEIDLKVNAINLDSKAVSGGKISISGDVPNQDVLVRTGGKYFAKKLSAEQTDVTVLAGGKAYINSDEYVDASVTAGGIIEIYGNPEKVKQDKTLGGSIVIRK